MNSETNASESDRSADEPLEDVGGRYDDFFDDENEGGGSVLTEYDISSNPNDFNVVTLNSYIDRDAIKMPSFQRNYVWDVKRASRWIESLLLGLPVPQLFLYEESRNSFLVIDGQQRLMTIYYYLHGRFPRPNKRSAIRKVFDECGRIPDDVFGDHDLFQDFRLRLSSDSDAQASPFNGLTYDALEESQATLDLRTVRCVVIKQNRPKDGDSSIFEIFNRLNTGGTNLKPQEIRACMFHSDFYAMLSKLNLDDGWRRFFGKIEPDLHMRDVEVILRSFAMLEGGEGYSTTMSRFLNEYSRRCMGNSDSRNEYLGELFLSFIKQCDSLDDRAFYGKKSNKFNIALFEAVFYAICKPLVDSESLVSTPVSADKVAELEVDPDFLGASSARTTNSSHVKQRLARACAIFNPDQV